MSSNWALTKEDATILQQQQNKLNGREYLAQHDGWLHDICNNGRNFYPPWQHGCAREWVTIFGAGNHDE